MKMFSMLRPVSPRSRHARGRILTLAAVAVVAGAVLPKAAEAHIKLMAPVGRLVTNAQGDPQKAGPCGGNGTRSNKRTVVPAGSKLMVEWQETVPHPGHFRIQFDDEGDNGFKDPVNQKDIVTTPTGTILADGLFPDHKVKTPLKHEVTLPNTPCKTCTLQLTQIMFEGANGVSMYYACADLELTAAATPDAGAPADASSGAGGTSGTGGTTSATGGTGGDTGGASGTGGTTSSAGGASGSGGTSSGSGGTSSGAGGAGRGGSSGAGGSSSNPPDDGGGSSGGCSVGGSNSSTGLGLLVLAGLLLVARRRRRA